MKRLLLFILLLFVTFVAGFVSAYYLAFRPSNYKEDNFLNSIAELRREIYGRNYFHLKGVFPDIESQLAAFDPAKSAGLITLSYVGGIGDADIHLELFGNGRFYSEVHGRRQLITTIPHEQCIVFFHRVLTSGILNYSDGVVELKKALLRPNSWSSIYDIPQTEISISVPELKVEQKTSINAPEVEMESFPDIIEFHLITQTEKELLDLVPKGYMLWKRLNHPTQDIPEPYNQMAYRLGRTLGCHIELD